MWKLGKIHYFAIALIYLGFFSLIGFAIYYTNSATPLWALLLMPSVSSNKDDEEID